MGYTETLARALKQVTELRAIIAKKFPGAAVYIESERGAGVLIRVEGDVADALIEFLGRAVTPPF